MKTINNITVADATLRSLHMIADKRQKPIDDIVAEMLEHGVKDTCYRMNRNAQKWQEMKATKERIKELEQMLAEKGE
jgi:hypothetical protein